VLWTRQFGTADAEEAFAVSVSGSGVYVAGFTFGTLGGTGQDQPNGGGSDAFLRKYDFDGNEVWTRQFGTAGQDRAFGVFADAACPSGVFLAGTTQGDLAGHTNAGDTDGFLCRYTADGAAVWTSQFGTAAADEALAVAVRGPDVFVAGRTEGVLPDQTGAGG